MLVSLELRVFANKNPRDVIRDTADLWQQTPWCVGKKTEDEALEAIWNRHNTPIRDFRHQMREDFHLVTSHYFHLSTLHINPNYQTSGFGCKVKKAVLLDKNFKPTVWARQTKLFCKWL